jgi:hypothetical protein
MKTPLEQIQNITSKQSKEQLANCLTAPWGKYLFISMYTLYKVYIYTKCCISVFSSAFRDTKLLTVVFILAALVIPHKAKKRPEGLFSYEQRL